MAELKAALQSSPSVSLTPRQLCDLELLLNGGFSPLIGFMTQADLVGVCSAMRLAVGTLWPITITLDIAAELAGRLQAGDIIALRDPEAAMLAAMRVEEV